MFLKNVLWYMSNCVDEDVFSSLPDEALAMCFYKVDGVIPHARGYIMIKRTVGMLCFKEVGRATVERGDMFVG